MFPLSLDINYHFVSRNKTMNPNLPQEMQNMNLEELRCGNLSVDEILKQMTIKRDFVTIIGGIRTNIVFNEYRDHFFIVVKQMRGEMAACKVLLRSNGIYVPTYEVLDIHKRDGLSQTAQIISAKLCLDKVTYMYLCLQNYGPCMAVGIADEILRSFKIT